MELKTESGTVWGRSPRDAEGAQLTLEAHEALSLNPVPDGLRVVCGLAWVTWRGRDIVLRPGEHLRFGRSGRPVLSSAGRGRVTVEMLG